MLTDEQRSFLKELQEQLNTQDHQMQADPRYWVVRETFYEPCWEEQTDEYEIVDDRGEVLGHVSRQLDIGECECVPVHKVDRNADGTFFLTLKDAQEHIRDNYYHYRDPHTYAMTAFRSPSFEKLLGILQTVDWDEV